jgi:hypothetical protein
MNRETWSPFQSEDVRKICAHLTVYELTELRRRARAYGTWGGITGAIPIGLAVAFPNPWTYALVASLLLVHGARLPSVWRAQKQFLCSTAWARQAGYTPDRLRLFSFVWQK